MSEILLIGVSHHDEKAPKKLASTLEEFEPNLILLEGSKSRTEAQETYVDELRRIIREGIIDQEIGQILLDEQAIKGFEQRTAFDYTKNAEETEVDYLNDSFSTQRLDEIRQAVRSTCRSVVGENPKRLKRRLAIARKAERAFAFLIRKTINTAIESKLTKNNRNIGPRDRLMAQTLREQLEHERICTITGMAHVLRNPQETSLFCKTQDLNPRRTLI